MTIVVGDHHVRALIDTAAAHNMLRAQFAYLQDLTTREQPLATSGHSLPVDGRDVLTMTIGSQIAFLVSPQQASECIFDYLS